MKFKAAVVAVALVAVASFAIAEDLKSGLQPGKFLNAFDVVKCSGATEDGVKVGDELCYRCKYGAQPMVMVFARTSDKNLATFAKSLDEVVGKHSDKNLKAFINLIGSDAESLKSQATELGEANKLANVPVVVPVESENGPEDYGVNPKADVTVILATGGKVVANHALAAEGLTEEAIAAILKDVPKLLN